jgi:hypothetical protein
MTKFLFFGAFLATTCRVAVQGQAIHQLYAALGVPLPLDHIEKWIGFFEDTKETLKACAVTGEEGTECDVYLNIHTAFLVRTFFTKEKLNMCIHQYFMSVVVPVKMTFVSLTHVILSASFHHFISTQFYLNPTAFGCNHAQLVVEDISDDGIIQFGVVDGKATSSNMNAIMKTCEEASNSGIGWGEVKWESGQVYQDRAINYLPARNGLGGKRKEACRSFNFEMKLILLLFTS